ncbi:MAG: hypothetical protein ACTSQU_06985 [Promethearchaeota archaeon]
MAQAIEKKTISKNHLEYDLPALTQNLAPEVIESQVLVLTTEEAQVESSSLSNKLLRVFNKIKYNARISEEKICINKYKGQVDAKLLGARNSMLKF